MRHQPKSNKHPYASPTTPGLYVTFRNYIIELVCINTNPKIGPRFWTDQTYWSPKYKREIRGISNLGKELDLTDALMQTSLVQIIVQYKIKALVAKKTISRVVRLTWARNRLLIEQRTKSSMKDQPVYIDPSKNSTFIDTGKKGMLAKVREAENG